MTNFIPVYCPACNTKLIVEIGKEESTIKLKCPNKDCSGQALKKFQKGIEALEIKGIGPSTTASLYDADIKSVADLFDINKFNEDHLIDSGLFKEGRALDKLILAVKSIKSISIDKLIESLQFEGFGTTISLQAGKYLSDVPYNFTGLLYDARDSILDKDSYVRKEISRMIILLEECGVEIKFFEKVEVKASKTLVKKVFINDVPSIIGLTKTELIAKLNWEETSIEECDIVAVEDKNSDFAKSISNKKVLTFKQIKILFLK